MILTDTSSQALAKAIEDNAVGFYLNQAQSPLTHLDGGDEMVRIMSDVKFPIGNVIIRARIQGEPNGIKTRVEDVLNPFRSHNIPMAWIIDSQSTPKNLGDYLIAEGLYRAPDVPGMAAAIAHITTPHPIDSAVTVVPVENEGMMEQWVHVFNEVFGLPDFAAEFWFENLISLGLEEDKPLRHYVAMLEGRVVGSSSLLFWNGVAGIYNVATVQSVRQRGIGAALTLIPLQQAQGEGYQIAVLQSSDMALNLYRKMGFQQYCRFEAYVWMGY
jgi:ribosomal protein S18 acetylase RimI-like enzyme